MRSMVCTLVLVALTTTERAASQADTRPNIVLVVTDDQRFDQMGCAGHPTLQTPNMDALAARGVSFPNSFVTTAICAASRASIMTGRREGRHGYTFGKPPMDESIARETWFHMLQQAGYRNGFVGKWGVKFADEIARKSFAFWRPMSPPYRRPGKPHLTDRAADTAVEFLRSCSDEQPFCLFLSFNAPHAEDNHTDQFLPADADLNLFETADVAVPPLSRSGFAALPPFLQSSLGRIRWGWRFDTREKQLQRTRDYWRMIHGVDRALGRVLAALEELGTDDETVVIFTSDNGYFLGERGLAGKWLIYEESIRVPLVIADPRIADRSAGRSQGAIALNIDLAPTILALAGVPAPASYEGRNLLPLLTGDAAEWRSGFLYEHHFAHPKIPKSIGVRGERWVYARYYEQSPVYEQLFDLQHDPLQLRNLATDPTAAGELERMRSLCEAWQRR